MSYNIITESEYFLFTWLILVGWFVNYSGRGLQSHAAHTQKVKQMEVSDQGQMNGIIFGSKRFVKMRSVHICSSDLT